MGLINLVEPSISGIGSLVKAIVGLTSSIAFGVVLFTIILKLVTLPFDFMSRRSMRKNSLLMEKMRPELEKLQKQYANDKLLYNQKMQALYKKNGYSMMGACLPTIITLVVFIIAINGFTTFANYQNQMYFYDMSISYNQAYYKGFVYNGDEPIKFGTTDGQYFEVVTNDKGEYKKIALKNSVLDIEEVQKAPFNTPVILPGSDFAVKKSNDFKYNYLTVLSAKGYVSFVYMISEGKLSNLTLKVDSEKLINANIGFTVDTNEDAEDFINNIAATNSYNTYKGINKSFLWVKNIWVTDSPMSHPINNNYNDFVKSFGTSELSKESYDNLIIKMKNETTQPNGYFILAILTAGVSLLLQIITSKSQKAQMELQTVDGQGARTNKMMTWMMPIMMAIFAFTMTAAFSIYMIVSSVISILTTILINKLVDYSFKRKALKEAVEANGTEKEIVRGRIYVKEPEPQPKKEKKKTKKEEPVRPDFMNDEAEKGKKKK